MNGPSCSRCSSPLLNQLQFDRGLCGMCLTGSLSALVALAASQPPDFEYEVDMPDHLIRQCIHGTVISQCRCASKSKHVIVAPECPAWCTGATSASQPIQTAWKADVFGDGAIQ